MSWMFVVIRWTGRRQTSHQWSVEANGRVNGIKHPHDLQFDALWRACGYNTLPWSNKAIGRVKRMQIPPFINRKDKGVQNPINDQEWGLFDVQCYKIIQSRSFIVILRKQSIVKVAENKLKNYFMTFVAFTHPLNFTSQVSSYAMLQFGFVSFETEQICPSFKSH